MHKLMKRTLPAAISLMLLGGFHNAHALVNVQCPGDDGSNGGIAGDAVIDDPTTPANVKCMHLTAGDSFAIMSDTNPLYTFGFGDRTGTDPANVIADGILSSEWSGPTIVLDEGDEFYLNLSNVGTVIRPDLFDPHTIHWHGFPNASTVFDGVPEVSISINMGSTLTYYYNVIEPGTYIYHCHVEATEHMEMGMLANLYVNPAQNGTAILNQADGNTYTQFVYNDVDGTTGYDQFKALQLASFDSVFHDASLFVQPLPFALLEGDYPQINGRGYPDTINPAALPAPVDNSVAVDGYDPGKVTGTAGEPLTNIDVNGGQTQLLDSGITVAQGEKLLLRLSNVGLDRFWTVTAPGLKMQLVGTGARHMRGVDGKNVYRTATSFNFGGGETHDVLIDTSNVAPGTYFLHATELHQMSNKTQFDGGMITEIVVN
ncbi:MAG: multicopper oxidase domain-containing protein [Candidatus Thiodiazotropha sp. (ex Monitilora ramsayi)]|nr:multicopper oxidase domain-containing protein [Candidatus Thiodiazotropha sp. (ex Monitilora ramsayi)]